MKNPYKRKKVEQEKKYVKRFFIFLYFCILLYHFTGSNYIAQILGKVPSDKCGVLEMEQSCKQLCQQLREREKEGEKSIQMKCGLS